MLYRGYVSKLKLCLVICYKMVRLLILYVDEKVEFVFKVLYDSLCVMYKWIRLRILLLLRWCMKYIIIFKI